MSIRVVCPNCQAAYTVADELHGKKARCQRCQTQIAIGVAPVLPVPEKPVPPPVVAVTAVPPPVVVVEAVEDVEAAAPRAPAPLRRRPIVDEDDVPRRRKKRKQTQSAGGLLIAILLIAGTFLTLLVVVGAVVWLVTLKDPTPETPAQTQQAGWVPNPFDLGPGGVGPEIPASDPPDDLLAKNDPGREAEAVVDPPLAMSTPGASKGPPPANPQLADDVLAKVKRATVFLRVTFGDSKQGQGSGFFGVEKNMILTNAHVLGMLQPGAKRPQKIEVVLHSGTAEEKTVPGVFVGVDRTSDLGLLRVNLDNSPPPLEVKSAQNLRETQQVWFFGYPFGSALGKDVSVGTATVSALRKDKDTGLLVKVQVNGDMQPGNSGGPVVDAWGDVVGVSVSIIMNTRLNFAVPGDYVHVILNGRITDMNFGQPYRDGEELKVPVTLNLLDPLKRISQLSLDTWTGKGDKSLAASLTAPAPKQGESQRLSLKLEPKTGIARGELTLPAALSAGQAYWVQPTYVTSGTKKWAVGRVYEPPPIVQRRSLEFKLAQKEGSSRPITVNQRFTLKIREAISDDNAIVSSLEAKMTDTVKSVDAQGKAVIERKFSRLRAGVRLDSQRPPQGHHFQSLVPLAPNLSAELQVDGRGQVESIQTNLRGSTHPGMQAAARELHDLCLQPIIRTLTATPPAKMLQPGETWKEQRSLPLDVGVGPFGFGQNVQEPLELSLTCTYAGTRKRDGKDEAVITVTGVARAPREEEGQNPGRVHGTLIVDPATSHTVEANLTVQIDLAANNVLGQALTMQVTQEVRLRQL